MALIKCPECGQDVSDQAKNCPKCAYPIKPEDSKKQVNTPPPQIVVKPQEGCFLQTLNTGCIIIAVIIGIIIIATIFSTC